jgi:hypothetical protein
VAPLKKMLGSLTVLVTLSLEGTFAKKFWTLVKV